MNTPFERYASIALSLMIIFGCWHTLMPQTNADLGASSSLHAIVAGKVRHGHFKTWHEVGELNLA